MTNWPFQRQAGSEEVRRLNRFKPSDLANRFFYIMVEYFRVICNLYSVFAVAIVHNGGTSVEEYPARNFSTNR